MANNTPLEQKIVITALDESAPVLARLRKELAEVEASMLEAGKSFKDLGKNQAGADKAVEKGIRLTAKVAKELDGIVERLSKKVVDATKDLDRQAAAWDKIAQSTKKAAQAGLLAAVSQRQAIKQAAEGIRTQPAPAPGEPVNATAGAVNSLAGKLFIQNKEAQEQAFRKAKKAGDGYASTLQAVGGLLAVGQIVDYTKSIIRLADEYRGLSSRLNLVASSAQEFRLSQEAVLKIALNSGQSLNEVANSYAKIRVAVRDAGGSFEDAVAVVQAFNNGLKISNTSTEGAAGASLQLSQGLAAGVLRGEELNSVLENNAVFARALARGLDVPIGQLKKLGEAGALTTRLVTEAVKKSQAELAATAAQIPLTFDQSLNNLKTRFQQYIGIANEASGTTSSLGKSIEFLGKQMDVLVPVLAGLAVGVAAVSLGVAAVALPITGTTLAVSGLLAGLTGLSTAFVLNRKEADKTASSYKDLLENANKLATSSDTVARKRTQTEIDAKLKELEDKQKALNEKAKSQSVNSVTEGEAARVFQLEKQKVTLSEIQAVEKEILSLMAAREKVTDATADGLKNQRSELLLFESAFKLNKTDTFGGLLANDKTAELLRRFEDGYKAFATNVRKENGTLAVSFSNIKLAAKELVNTAESSTELTLAIDSLQTKLVEARTRLSDNALSSNVSSAVLKRDRLLVQAFEREIGNAIVKREEVDRKALDDTIKLFESRAKRVLEIYSRVADSTLSINSRANTIATVFAELQDDVVAVSKLQSELRNLEVAAARDTLDVTLDVIEKRRRAREESLVQDLNAQVDQNITLQQRTFDALNKDLAANKQALDDKTISREAYEKINLEIEQKYNSDRKQLAKEELQDVDDLFRDRVLIAKEYTRKEQQINEAAQEERYKLLNDFRSTLESRLKDSLSAYKAHASKVIALDREIAKNRRDASFDIREIQRTGLAPRAVQEDRRSELSSLRSQTQELLKQSDLAKDPERIRAVNELIDKQKQLASQIGNDTSAGENTTSLRDELISNLKRLEKEREAVLVAERELEQEAANASLIDAQNFGNELLKIDAQLQDLNERAKISLQFQVNDAQITSLVNTIQSALNASPFSIRVVPEYAPTNTAPSFPEPLRRAAGGYISGPGTSTSDSIPALLSNGEFVMRANAVRQFGVGFMNMLNAGRVPRFNSGGVVGQTLGTSQRGGATVNLTIGGSTLALSATPSVADELTAIVRRERLKAGNR